VVLGYNVFVGVRKGLVRLLLEMMALSIGIAIGYKYYKILGGVLESYIAIPHKYSVVIGFCLVWVFCYVLLMFLAKLLDSFISKVQLGGVNKVAGIIAGILRGGIMLLPILIIVIYFKPLIIKQAVIGHHFEPFVRYFVESFSINELIEKRKQIPDIFKGKLNTINLKNKNKKSIGIPENLMKIIDENDIDIEALKKIDFNKLKENFQNNPDMKIFSGKNDV
jgi:membrane protein required for colicin V production